LFPGAAWSTLLLGSQVVANAYAYRKTDQANYRRSQATACEVHSLGYGSLGLSACGLSREASGPIVSNTDTRESNAGTRLGGTVLRGRRMAPGKKPFGYWRISRGTSTLLNGEIRTDPH
jgi:hypothetical protein